MIGGDLLWLLAGMCVILEVPRERLKFWFWGLAAVGLALDVASALVK